MRAFHRLFIALASDTCSAGLELSGFNNEPLGKLLLGLTLMLYLWATFGFIQEWLGKRSGPVGDGSDDDESRLPSRNTYVLSRSEGMAVRSVIVAMLASDNHAHMPDTIAMAEDLKAGRSLQGPCGVCGKPRLRL